jgi:RNA polymerase sigma-70 factor (ECF subfamily)
MGDDLGGAGTCRQRDIGVGHAAKLGGLPPTVNPARSLTSGNRWASKNRERMIDAAQQEDASVDGALIEQWKAGDQRAATAIVERHAEALARFAARLGGKGDVDEVVQDTFVRAFSALDTFRAESSLRTWLFTIARRLVIDRQRASARQRQLVDLDDGHATTEYDALDGLLADEVSTRVARAIARLTRMQREVFTLRVQEGRSYRDIAEILDSTEGAARVHYHNAMRAVKEFLDD